jgi:hypothetical protein
MRQILLAIACVVVLLSHRTDAISYSNGTAVNSGAMFSEMTRICGRNEGTFSRLSSPNPNLTLFHPQSRQAPLGPSQ